MQPLVEDAVRQIKRKGAYDQLRKAALQQLERERIIDQLHGEVTSAVNAAYAEDPDAFVASNTVRVVRAKVESRTQVLPQIQKHVERVVNDDEAFRAALDARIDEVIALLPPEALEQFLQSETKRE
jgi:hypothetical protein